MASENSTIHASAVLVGAKAALIRGPSGAGKSRLAWALLQAVTQGALPFARLVTDDRTHIEVHHGMVLVRPAKELAGLLEVHGLGIRRLPYEPLAGVGLVIDLAAADAARHPELQAAAVAGVTLPRLAIAAGMAPLPLVLAHLQTPPAER